MSRLRVAVIGVGHLGRHHARILSGLDHVELVGVADARADQAAAIAGPLGTRAFSDYRELLHRVDAVSIAVPTFLHREVALEFLDRGISCLVEKPLAGNSADAREILAAARRTGSILAVGHVERFNPALAAYARLGWQPRYINAERLATYTFRSTDIGVVHDLMIHDLDLILSLVPAPVTAVSAVGVSIFGEREDVANARVQFGDGTVAMITASRASFQGTRKMRLWAQQGYATLDFGTRQATVVEPTEALRAGKLSLDQVDLTKPAAIKDHVFGTLLRAQEIPAAEGGRDQLTEELDDFVTAVRKGRDPRVTGADACRALDLADEIVHSLEIHAWDGTPDGRTGPRLASRPSGVPAPKLFKHGQRPRNTSEIDFTD